jgi:hypothetical protein
MHYLSGLVFSWFFFFLFKKFCGYFKPSSKIITALVISNTLIVVESSSFTVKEGSYEAP